MKHELKYWLYITLKGESSDYAFKQRHVLTYSYAQTKSGSTNCPHGYVQPEWIVNDKYNEMKIFVNTETVVATHCLWFNTLLGGSLSFSCISDLCTTFIRLRWQRWYTISPKQSNSVAAPLSSPMTSEWTTLPSYELVLLFQLHTVVSSLYFTKSLLNHPEQAQTVQNTVARIITRTSRISPITPVKAFCSRKQRERDGWTVLGRKKTCQIYICEIV